LILFKSDREKFEDEIAKAINDRNKGNLEGAVNHYLKAYEIASRTTDPDVRKRSGEALFYALFYDALIKKTPEAFSKAAEACGKLESTHQLDIGIAVKPAAGDLARDLEIASMIFSLPKFDVDAVGSMDQSVASLYEKVGNRLLMEGSRRLIIEDILGIHEELNTIGLRLIGYSKVIEAFRLEADNPGRAVELYSEALSYLQQATPEVRNYVNSKLAKLAKATKCWVCHREIQGEDVNYLYLPASINTYILEKYGAEASHLISEGRIAVCRVCYTMVYNLSDALARKYYDMAIAMIREVEARLEARIRSLESKIIRLESKIPITFTK